MGFWKTERGTGADAWADTLGNCMKELQEKKLSGYCDVGEDGHEITMQEFADLVEFCSRGHLVVNVRYSEDGGSLGERPLSKLYGKEVNTYHNKGQIHCPELCEV